MSTDQNLDTLNRVFDGVDITPEERRTIEWLARCERRTIENLARLVCKAQHVAVARVLADFERMGQEMIDASGQKAEGGS